MRYNLITTDADQLEIAETKQSDAEGRINGDNMKVLHLLQSNRFSGAENVACQIIHMMGREADYEMVYCSPDGQIREALAERNVMFAPINKMSVSEVKRVLREQKPDVIHAHDMGASFFAALACGKTSLISHIHNNNFDSQKPTLKAILYRCAASKAKHIFWVSRAAQDGYFFSKGLRKKSSVLYNVIDTQQLRQKAAEAACKTAYDVVYLGRLTYPKNPQKLLSVLEKVIAQKPDTKVAIVGSGELEEEVRQIVAEKNMQNNVDLLGFMSNPYGILQNAKVMLMTSRWEGLPMCALEAMALGVPIISTPTDGVRELVEDGKDGYLTDDDEVLIEKVLQLVGDATLQKRMAQAAHEKSETVNNMEQYSSQLIRQYLGDKRK